MDEQARYEKARKRVEEIKGFYTHLLTYVLVNLALLVLNLITSPGSLWFYWPLFGWGVGVLAHAGSVFGPGRFWGPEWEERKIKELMKKEQEGE
ncbi:MAG: 2TM domain-containing protein [Candidatus Eisenbacteria sp.]|nr:2TM domain-containing protein [Candidatus Eisenbacteria bacterium]